MDEIVRRLRSRSQERIIALKESMPVDGINEADEDENDELTAEEDFDTADLENDIPEEDNEEDTSEEETEEEPEKKSPPENNPNPLDNIYAVNFKLGQEVVLNFSSATESKLEGIIEGYDKEGFYRVKWDNGLTTNGITDIAISELLDAKAESKCVCGGTDFVNEGNNIVCDRCGRLIKESKDPLTLADKSRPKGKRMIRSEAHPISTAISEDKSSTIHNRIRKAFSKKNINEADEESDIFDRLRDRLGNEFWTRLPELVEDIESLGYTVDDYNNEYIVVSIEDEEGEDYGLLIPVGGTSRTMTLDFDRARKA